MSVFLILLFILSREVAFDNVTNIKTVIGKLKFLFKTELAILKVIFTI